MLFLYSHNIEQTAGGEVVLPLLTSLGFGAAVFLAIRVTMRDWRKAGLVASTALFLFFTYGHIHGVLRRQWPMQFVWTGIALLLLSAAVIACVVLLASRAKRDLATVTSVLNILAAAITLVPLVRIAAFETGTGRADVVLKSRPELPGLAVEHEPAALPDIYFIVMDRYPSASTLAEIYGYDNSPFLDYLSRKGFFVAGRSTCNYARTDMSLPATLNMMYLDAVAKEAGHRRLLRVLHSLTQDYAVWRFLKERGYRYLHFGTGWRTTSRNRYADANYNRVLMDEFATMFYRTTMLVPVGALLGFDGQTEQYQRVRYQFEQLARVPGMDVPTFTFAHFLLPHEPYVFRRDGSRRSRLAQMGNTVEECFVDQLEYANGQLRVLVDRILADSPTPPVIIIESDEGPHAPQNFGRRDSVSSVRASYRILSALYLPGVDQGLLSDRLSPVNVFRLVFNQYFGTRLERLPDRSYVYTGEGFRDVTDVVAY